MYQDYESYIESLKDNLPLKITEENREDVVSCIIKKGFKKIEDDEYYINNFGVVLNLSIHSHAKLFVKKHLDRDGYQKIHIRTGVIPPVKYRFVHRLVAILFLPIVKGRDFVRHEDLDRINNSVSNLWWSTSQEIVQHCINNERRGDCSGYKNGMTKIKTEDVLEIRASKDNQRNIAKKYGISQAQVCRIKLKINRGKE